MFLKSISLRNFRNHIKSEFNFDQTITFVVGPNTSGKTNLIEAILFLTTGESLRSDRAGDAVAFGKTFARIKGAADNEELEVLITDRSKKYLVNGVSKRRIDFIGRLAAVSFLPSDLELVTDSPGIRRRFLDTTLEAVDLEYRISLAQFYKALRQRNALLQRAKERGVRNKEQFEYWDGILIASGNVLTEKRERLIDFLNQEKKTIFDFEIYYDKSIISKARLSEYQEAEKGAGVTLVGPHRDDFVFSMAPPGGTRRGIKAFASRGQQRLTVLELKFLQLVFFRKALGREPVLLLDDIFSELDEKHIELVVREIAKGEQVIITTTHKELIPNSISFNSRSEIALKSLF
ncbi:DNA replication and repair protein RecF [Patescibacteria group bacterium]|nr:DNA replication and repair protein RecF [Patescibacteria group bacterium]